MGLNDADDAEAAILVCADPARRGQQRREAAGASADGVHELAKAGRYANQGRRVFGGHLHGKHAFRKVVVERAAGNRDEVIGVDHLLRVEALAGVLSRMEVADDQQRVRDSAWELDTPVAFRLMSQSAMSRNERW